MFAASLILVLTAALAPVLPVPQAAAQTETATQVYLRYRATAATAKSIDEITAFWSAGLISEFNMMPQPDRAATLDMAKRMEARISDVTVTKETTTPAGVTLSLEAVAQDKKPMVGS